MSVTVDQVPMWLILDRIGHVVGSVRNGWIWCLCGTWTPNGQLTKEKPKRICRKCLNRTQTAERDAYGIQELADLHGVHRTTIYREIWAGRLSTFKLRGRTLISRDAVEAWRDDMKTLER